MTAVLLQGMLVWPTTVRANSARAAQLQEHPYNRLRQSKSKFSLLLAGRTVAGCELGRLGRG